MATSTDAWAEKAAAPDGSDHRHQGLAPYDDGNDNDNDNDSGIGTAPPATPGSSEEGLDDNYRAYKHSRDADISEVEARAVLRRIDMRIVPVLFWLYLLQYLDK